MKLKIYVESSVISYLTARSSRDIVILAHQQITQVWWEEKSKDFELYISPLVDREISRGDPTAAAKRKEILVNLNYLKETDDIGNIALDLISKGSLPTKALEDALHIAIAAYYEMDFLLTWNCAHIANAATRKLIDKILTNNRLVPPTICTPEELLGRSSV